MYRAAPMYQMCRMYQSREPRPPEAPRAAADLDFVGDADVYAGPELHPRQRGLLLLAEARAQDRALHAAGPPDLAGVERGRAAEVHGGGAAREREGAPEEEAPHSATGVKERKAAHMSWSFSPQAMSRGAPPSGWLAAELSKRHSM